MKSLRTILHGCTITAVVLALSGCWAPSPGKGVYMDPYDLKKSSAGVDMYDYDLVIKKMTESLVEKLKPREGKTPVITFGGLLNKTPYKVDSRQIMEDIRIEILETESDGVECVVARSADG